MGNLENYAIAWFAILFLLFLGVLFALAATVSAPLRIGDDFDVVSNSDWYVCVISEVESDLELQCLKTGEK